MVLVPNLQEEPLYALHSRGEQEESPNVITSMLLVFSIDVYDLLDLGVTMSFVTSLVAGMLDILLDIFIEPFLVTKSMGDFVVVKRVFRSSPISFPNRFTWVELV